MARNTIAVLGYTDFMRACNRADRETKAFVRKTLATSGERVRSEAAVRFSSTSSKTAAGFRSRANLRGVFVGQRLRKTTGMHPEYGALQMRRALLPAFEANRDRVEHDLERAIDRVCDHFGDR